MSYGDWQGREGRNITETLLADPLRNFLSDDSIVEAATGGEVKTFEELAKIRNGLGSKPSNGTRYMLTIGIALESPGESISRPGLNGRSIMEFGRRINFPALVKNVAGITILP